MRAAAHQVAAEAALIVLGDDRALGLVALVQEGHPEPEADVAEDARVLGPGDHRARRHHGRDVAGHEAGARQIGERDHGGDRALALVVLAVVRHLREHDLLLDLGREIVERRDDVPAVHLTLVDLLRAVIEAGGVAKADRVRGREQAERLRRPHDLVLVEQGELALDLEHALDHEHDVGPAGVVLVEHQRDRVLQRPRQDALAERGHLLTVLEHDRVLADQVDAADVAVEVDAHARPVEARGDLLDVGRLAGAVIALDHDPAVEGEPGQDRHRGLGVEVIGLVEVGHVVAARRERRHGHVGVEPERLPHRDLDVRAGQRVGRVVHVQVRGFRHG